MNSSLTLSVIDGLTLASVIDADDNEAYIPFDGIKLRIEFGESTYVFDEFDACDLNDIIMKAHDSIESLLVYLLDLDLDHTRVPRWDAWGWWPTA